MADDPKGDEALGSKIEGLLSSLSPAERAILEKRGLRLPEKAPPREPRLSPEDRAEMRQELGIDELDKRIDVVERHARGEGEVPQPRRPAPTTTEPPR